MTKNHNIEKLQNVIDILDERYNFDIQELQDLNEIINNIQLNFDNLIHKVVK